MPSPSTAGFRLEHEAEELRRRQRSLPPRAMRDVTDDFLAACKQLQPGDLIQDEYFTLFEAVGALEIMDPKMDSGCVPPGDSFEPEFGASRELSPSQVLWIMDEIFRLEMSFHDGYPLNQNLFTSLHIFELISPDGDLPGIWYNTLADAEEEKCENALVHTVLWTYCVAVIKCVQPILGTISGQMYFEEEDFVTSLFGRELLPSVTHQFARKALVEAMDWLDGSSIDVELKYAIKYRLVCRQYLLFSMDKAHECWENLREKLVATHKNGTNVFISHHELATETLDAFSNKVTRQLATSTPPRPMPSISLEEARIKWMQMCDDILAAQRLTALPIREIPLALQRATWAFAYRNPEPNTFARAKMQDILCADDSVGGTTPHWDLMLSDLRDLTLAGDSLADVESFQIELPSDPRHKSSRLIEEFMVKAFPEWLNLYRAVCQNRCRLRRILGQSIAGWHEIGRDAIRVDGAIAKIVNNRMWKRSDDGSLRRYCPLSSWAAIHKYRVMAWYMQLGFETELYLPRELSLIYAALAHIFGEQERPANWSKGFNDDKMLYAKTKEHEQYLMECASAGLLLQALHCRSLLDHGLASGLCAIYTALEDLHLIDTRSMDYGTPEQQFEARMKVFLAREDDNGHDAGLISLKRLGKWKSARQGTVGESLSAYIPQLLKMLRTQLASLKKFSPSEAHFIGTEKEWAAEIKALERTVIALGVEASKLQKVCEMAGVLGLKEADLSRVVEVELPFCSERYHPWWAVPRIKEKKQKLVEE